MMESVRRMVTNFDETALDPYIIPVGVNYTVQLYDCPTVSIFSFRSGLTAVASIIDCHAPSARPSVMRRKQVFFRPPFSHSVDRSE